MAKVHFLETVWGCNQKNGEKSNWAQKITDSLYEKMQNTNKLKASDVPKIIIGNSTCPSCSGNKWEPDNENGCWICYDCGFKGDDVIDQGQEWRQYNGDDSRRSGDQCRVGIPVHDYFRKSSLSTCIRGRINQGGYQRLQRYQSMDPEERKLLYSFKLLDQNVSPTDVNLNIREKAKYLYKCISDTAGKPTHRKRSVAACVYLACKNGQHNAEMGDVSKWFYINKKKVAKGCKQSREALFQNHPECLKQLQPHTTEMEIKRIQGLLGEVHPSVIESAQELARIAQEFGVGLRAVPTSLAVGCLWWIYQEATVPWTITDIAKITPCSDVTVHKSWNLLMVHKEMIEVFRKVRPTNRQPAKRQTSDINWVKRMYSPDCNLGNAQIIRVNNTDDIHHDVNINDK